MGFSFGFSLNCPCVGRVAGLEERFQNEVGEILAGGNVAVLEFAIKTQQITVINQRI